MAYKYVPPRPIGRIVWIRSIIVRTFVSTSPEVKPGRALEPMLWQSAVFRAIPVSKRPETNVRFCCTNPSTRFTPRRALQNIQYGCLNSSHNLNTDANRPSYPQKSSSPPSPRGPP